MIDVEFTLRFKVPEHDLDLITEEVLERGSQAILGNSMGHYQPKVERVTKDWQIEAQRRERQLPQPLMGA